MTNFSIPKEVDSILEELERNGFEAFLVGGCVRDLLLDKTPKDWDVTTNAKPEEIQKIFKDTFYENNFGTVGVKTESQNIELKVIEVTPYRLESAYSDNRHPDKVLFSNNLEDDLKRRDFTINSIALSRNGELKDIFKGQDDIKSGVIRTVGEPSERFNEDALRILRAIRFSAQLGFTIDSGTLIEIGRKGDNLNNISRERVKDEFVKIIMSENPMIGLVLLQKMALIKHISPALEEMVGVEQNKEAHKYDVWEHSLRALQHSADKNFPLEVRLAALFHDIAKPSTKRVGKGGKTTFFGHEVVGANVTRETLENLKFSREITDKVTKLVRWHMFFADPEQITLTAVRRMIVRVGEDNIWDLMNVRKCDRIGTGTPKEEPFRFRKYQSMIEEALRDPISVKMLKIDGEILMKEVDVPEGPKIGQILFALFDEVLEDPQKNTLDYLKDRAKTLLNLKDSELADLGKKGREKIESEDKKEVEGLRKKRGVK